MFTSAAQSESHKKSFRGWLLIASFSLFAIAFVTTHFFQLPASAKAVTQALGGLEILDRKPSFSSAEVYSRIGSFPGKGIQLYKRFTHTMDIVFPLTLLSFLLLLCRFAAQQYLNNRVLTRVLYALPFIWFSTDMLENGIVYYLLDEFPDRHDLLAATLGDVTLTKFSFVLLSVAGPAIATVFRRKLVTSSH